MIKRSIALSQSEVVKKAFMLDLSRHAVHQFWYQYDKRTLYRIVTSMEGIEPWAADEDPEVADSVVALGEYIGGLRDFEITQEAVLIKLLANLHSGQALRLMQYLDVTKPGTASKLLVYAEEQTKDPVHKNPYADLFLKRNLAFERLQLLGEGICPGAAQFSVKSLRVQPRVAKDKIAC